MIRITLTLLIGTVIFIAGTGCKTSKQLAYFKDLPQETSVSTLQSSPYAPLKLQPNDEVQITISSISPEASSFFNLMAVAPANSSEGVGNHNPQSFINAYRINDSGYVTMPVLNNIRASGLTTDELKQAIAQRLKDYLKEAVVAVNLTNFKVTVIGEVGHPVVVPVNGQTINVLEAVGAAGDLTVYGIRKNVKIIRKQADGTTQVAVLDFNDSKTLLSPWFQLKQNDIVYVQPRKSKGVLGTRAAIWVPIITSLAYIAAVIVTRN